MTYLGLPSSPTAPVGLDVRYTLDLTKLCMRPTREGLMLLEKLTGLSMDDIIGELPQIIQAHETGIASWIATCIIDPTAITPFQELYSNYAQWYQNHISNVPRTLPLRKCIAKELRHLGYRNDTRGGSVRFFWIGVGG